MWSLFWRSSNSIIELELSLALYEPLVWIAGWLVLFGVVMEVVAEHRTFKNEGRRHSLKKWGECLLIIGLVGEIVFGIATSIISGLIIAKLHLATAKAEERTAQLQSLLGSRRVTEPPKLSQYSGIRVDIFVLPQADRSAMDEALAFGRDMVDALGKSMLVSGYLGSGCQRWLGAVGVILQAPQDLSRERYAAGDILDSLRAAGIAVAPYVSPLGIPCLSFSDLSPKPAGENPLGGLAKIRIIIGKKPTPILKFEQPAQNFPNHPVKQRGR